LKKKHILQQVMRENFSWLKFDKFTSFMVKLFHNKMLSFLLYDINQVTNLKDGKMNNSTIKPTKKLKVKRVDVTKLKEQQKKVLSCGMTCGAN